jgi:hypothetical protein
VVIGITGPVLPGMVQSGCQVQHSGGLRRAGIGGRRVGRDLG